MKTSLFRFCGVLLLAAMLAPVCVHARKNPKNPKNNMRLLYWNIQNGMWSGQGDNYDKFVEWVRAYDPDVCVWCEAQSIYKTGTADKMDVADRYLVGNWGELAARYGHKYWYVGGHRDNYPQVITSKYPIENVERIVGSKPDSVVTHGAGWARSEKEGKTGNIAFDLSNNVEMKVKSSKDSTGFKKLSIIDELGLSMSYNMAAKEKPLSDLTMRIRLKWWKNYTFNMTAVFASYAYELDKNGRPYVGNHTLWGMRKLFHELEGVDIYSAAGVALASLVNAVNAGKIEKDATVMLNVTGGGEEHFKEGKELWYLKPSHVFPLEPDEADVVEKVEALFN